MALLKTAHISLKPDEEITFFYEKRKEKKNKTKTLLSEKGYVKRLNYFFSFKRVVREKPVELKCGAGLVHSGVCLTDSKEWRGTRCTEHVRP